MLGIGDQPYDELKPELKDSLNEYYKVGSLENYDEVYRAVAFFAFKYGRIDWLESNNEYWLERDAALRTDFHITSGFQTADMPRIKYKSKMKEYYQKAGIATARYHMVDDYEGCRKFIDEVGYPVVVKPDNGVGASDTHKLSSDEDLKKFLVQKTAHHPDVEYIMEEFVRAEVNSYDAIIDANGNPIFEAGNVSPMSIMDIVNDNDNSIYYIIKDLPEDTRAAGRAAVKSFGVKSRFIHFEFFRMTENQASMGKKGQIVALEVNMRPCGGFTPDMINFARSTNVYKIWADMIAFGGTDMPVGEHFYCPFAGRRDGKHFVYSHEQIMQKYQQNIRMVDRMPDALSGAMGNQMYVATFSTREGMEQFYSDVLATTDATNAAAQKELSSILALGEPETAPAEKPAAPAAKKARTTKARTTKKSKNTLKSPGMACPFRGFSLSLSAKCAILLPDILLGTRYIYENSCKRLHPRRQVPRRRCVCHCPAANFAPGHQDHPRLCGAG